MAAQRPSLREANIRGAGGQDRGPLSLERWAGMVGTDPQTL